MKDPYQYYCVLPFNVGFRIWKKPSFWQLGYIRYQGSGRKSFNLGPFEFYWGW